MMFKSHFDGVQFDDFLHEQARAGNLTGSERLAATQLPRELISNPNGAAVPEPLLAKYRAFGEAGAVPGVVQRLSSLASAGTRDGHPERQQSQSQPEQTSMKEGSFLTEFDRLTKQTSSAFERLEFARRGQSESELTRETRQAWRAMERERYLAQHDPIGAILADPDQHFYWDAMARYLGGARLSKDQLRFVEELRKVRGLDPSSTLGDALFPIPMSTDVFDLLLQYGAFRDLGARPMPSTKTKFAKVTALPTAVFITPSATGSSRVIPADTSLAGANVSQECNTVAALIEASIELLQDEKVDLADVLLRLFIQAIAARIDYAAFQGDGTDNTVSGAQTGLFQDGTVASVAANSGNVALTSLERNDFLNAVGAVAAAALQRPCRWFINPAFIPALLTLRDGVGNTYLLKTPAETQGLWHLVGFPVTWTAQAPSATTPGSKVALFGEPNSYLVGIREDLELGTAAGAKFSQAMRQIRALARVRCDMRESTGFATLKLAAS